MVIADADSDGVLDDFDRCPDPQIPEEVPWISLRPNHYALVNNDLVFDTRPIVTGSYAARLYRARGRNSDMQGMRDKAERVFTTSDTGGCSCSQILEARGLGSGLSKYGCSAGVMNSWMNILSDTEADAGQPEASTSIATSGADNIEGLIDTVTANYAPASIDTPALLPNTSALTDTPAPAPQNDDADKAIPTQVVVSDSANTTKMLHRGSLPNSKRFSRIRARD